GDNDALYRYSGLRLSPNPWTEALKELKVLCEKNCGQSFNSVLANCYRDGQDSMGWHSDNEAELGVQPVIASVSLGQIRNFDFRHNTSGEKYRQALESGSLLLMKGDTQLHWQHAMAKTTQVLQPRVNLTFRYVFPTKA
ncbi:MAG: alkylated DNA repair dioxygenase AlkB, partial [Paraglaciecola sp.]